MANKIKAIPVPTILDDEKIEVIGARSHNLKNIDVTIPRNKLVVITGLSGSGKSSLAFDTIYAEGQRRYIESFSAYARQFLGGLERPDVDQILGLSPVISIEQKTVNKNPRSTVGTITEIYDFFRLLYARAGEAYSYVTGERMIRYTDDQIIDLVLNDYANKKIVLLAPIVKGRKGHYRELFEQFRKSGFTKVRVDGVLQDIAPKMQLDRYKIHDIEVVIDRLEITATQKQRFSQSLNTAMKQGKGSVMILLHEAEEEKKAKSVKGAKSKSGDQKVHGDVRFFSRLLMCPSSGIAYDEPQPNLFSFNSPYGACSHCNGLGVVSEIDIDKIVPHKNKSIKKGALIPLGDYKQSWIFRQIEALGSHFGFNLDTPFEDLDEESINAILYGTEEILKVKLDNNSDNMYNASFDGIVNFIVKQNEESTSPAMLKWVQGFMNKKVCPDCNGARLKKEALYFKIDNKNISEISDFDVTELHIWSTQLEKRLNAKQNVIAKEILKEIRSRISFLLDVGLDYVSLNRSSKTLSGGEAQRIRLATQIGSQLVGVLYILDEPSIGLHQRDNTRLIQSLKNLRDVGNSILVVEHDKEMIESSDYVIDIGPGAGVHGGQVVAACHPRDLKKTNSITSQYFSGERSIAIPKVRRKGNGKTLSLLGAKGNNLKNVSIHLPLGTFICVTGVSGSGKSTLINETLYPILSNYFYKSETRPLVYKAIEGIEAIDKIIEIDQSPIGRTPRSNPATYTKLFDDIRNLFAVVPEAQIRGYKAGRFSFNVKGGRCETCQGGGMRVIEMNFLPDVYVQCETCSGKRYNRETLEVRYKGKSISDVLDMTIEQATTFFENIPWIHNRVKTLKDVGLGYITLGQQATTLSGGEAQRVKLATELSKRGTGNTFYILDEPTTGLHFEDVKILLEVLQRLVDAGNTVLVIEHNMDIIKTADYIIDMGPEGGKKGGTILCDGTPEQIIKNKESYTAAYLKLELNQK